MKQYKFTVKLSSGGAYSTVGDAKIYADKQEYAKQFILGEEEFEAVRVLTRSNLMTAMLELPGYKLLGWELVPWTISESTYSYRVTQTSNQSQPKPDL
jgi:hypothetical protein